MTTRSSPARVLQLVPPGPGGVRDYAETLRENGLGGDVREVKEPVAIDWTTYDVVLVQYSGYGYSRRGAPQWLTEWLNDNRSLIKCLGVFFHELYAPSVPWRSAFWFGYQQKAVLKSLARISDFWLTNREESGDWLRRNAGSGLHQIVLPTSSAVGE